MDENLDEFWQFLESLAAQGEVQDLADAAASWSRAVSSRAATNVRAWPLSSDASGADLRGLPAAIFGP